MEVTGRKGDARQDTEPGRSAHVPGRAGGIVTGKGQGDPGGMRRAAYGSAVLAGDGGIAGDRPAPA
ncbi:hypothetical protein DESPIG_02177 [Desulfovibrio piger ATCC 29098]|uniref:Uncharacterized protein n=1 Tax=Desulfovibrio piger ATCC 29098 TaxID=411464 RepID=B6WVQ9_9BACT|nr:hypothetical protein DESPIG_02177 [Desulfovibrio piger ATCC 29098]